MKFSYQILSLLIVFLINSCDSNKRSVKTMDNGLVIEDLVVGEGEGAKDYNKVVVNYTGTLEDGSIFDSSLN